MTAAVRVLQAETKTEQLFRGRPRRQVEQQQVRQRRVAQRSKKYPSALAYSDATPGTLRMAPVARWAI